MSLTPWAHSITIIIVIIIIIIFWLRNLGHGWMQPYANACGQSAIALCPHKSVKTIHCAHTFMFSGAGFFLPFSSLFLMLSIQAFFCLYHRLSVQVFSAFFVNIFKVINPAFLCLLLLLRRVHPAVPWRIGFERRRHVTCPNQTGFQRFATYRSGPWWPE